MTTHKLSIKGCGKVNEDCIETAVFNRDHIVAVSDGMGGMDFGDIAAETVSSSLVKYVIEHNEPLNEQQLLHNALKYADSQLAEKMRQLSVQMGAATLVAIISPHHLSFSWQGNVRIYLKHDGKLTLLSTDHQIDTGYGDYRLTRCIKGQGLRQPLPFEEFQLAEGDCIYICTDGFYTDNFALINSDKAVDEMKELICQPQDDATLVVVTI
ncbi:MAG: PP2C family protein-serine/threonine phosphatase [Prevotella sp.]|jgi:serine/threonine protein phosphatase PrpC